MGVQESNVFVITELIIKEIIAHQVSHESSIKSVGKIADLFVNSVLSQNIFKEKKYFEIEENIILDDEFYDAIKDVCFEFRVSESSLDTIKNFFSQNESKKYTYEVPYEYITNVIYKQDEEIDYTIVDEKLTSIATAISNKITDYEDYEKKVLEKVFRKFRRHLLLSIYQKNHITKITKEHSIKAGELAQEATQVAGNAKRVSNEAKQLSETARNMYDNMMVNYITILGIFASIIITVFGGINLTNATVKLLESEHDLPMMVFAVSFLMIGFISILIVLITWISSLRKDTEYRSAVKWWILGGFCVISLFSGLFLNHKIKVSTECQIGYYTCIHMEALNSPYMNDKK
ncbi:hypothetical protein E2K73_07880 [Acinetobacter sp. RF15A]|uniref:hypothetical protein n=1 Tax=unclassified Acinetobacter TaxID=196816 RepID=UPI001193082D|nr:MULTISPECIES: hypothetical protein [unclassified Acinetobacter]TSH74918.1 hypothetical protein E2K73_07880 [Acinetobacter sp. RF15A]TSI20385.1 hypothetical protein E2K74_02825 [Acinetobacter sp. RF15B]